MFEFRSAPPHRVVTERKTTSSEAHLYRALIDDHEAEPQAAPSLRQLRKLKDFDRGAGASSLRKRVASRNAARF
jgi:hypothetical protein